MPLLNLHVLFHLELSPIAEIYQTDARLNNLFQIILEDLLQCIKNIGLRPFNSD